MKYVNNTLMSNEKLIFCTRPHWVIFMPIAVWIIITVLVLIYGPRLGFSSIVFFKMSLDIFLSLITIVIALFHALSAYITYISSEFAITDKRALMKIGLIQRTSLEIFLDKIESIHVRQSIFGRILNYGSIIISGTGGSKDPFNYIPNPLQFRKQFQEQM